MPAPNARRRYSQGRHDPITILVRFVYVMMLLAAVLFLAFCVVAGGILSLFS